MLLVASLSAPNEIERPLAVKLAAQAVTELSEQGSFDNTAIPVVYLAFPSFGTEFAADKGDYAGTLAASS